MNEAEYLMKNYGDRGGCYPSAEADNTLRDGPCFFRPFDFDSKLKIENQIFAIVVFNV